MIMAYVVLLLTDAILCMLARMLSKQDWSEEGGAIPLWVAFPLCIGAIAAHTTGSVLLARSVTNPEVTAIVLVSFVVMGILPIAAFVHMLSASIVNSSVDGMYSWNYTAAKPASDMGRAHARLQHNDMQGALREFRKCYEADPDNPEALFQIASILEGQECHDEAVRAYREITARFANQDASWAAAAYRLALIHERSLCDQNTADALFHEIVERKPHLAIARRARAHLDVEPALI